MAWTIDKDRIRKYMAMEKTRENQSIYIEYRSHRSGPRWAVTNGIDAVMAKSGNWEWEPSPSSRTPAFLKRCRFKTFEAALEAAAQHNEEVK